MVSRRKFFRSEEGEEFVVEEGEGLDFEELRRRMVKEQLRSRDITDERMLRAFLKVPRHEFVPPEQRLYAYEDHPLPIGMGQTISQPYMVALMTQALELKGEEKVLEIGTGSGYQAAILAELCREVHTVERFPELAERAKETLRRLGYKNVFVHTGDGTKGLPSEAPFDGIIVTAGAPSIPPPLVEQLSEGGRLVIPVGGRPYQMLIKGTKRKGKLVKEEVCGCLFVPLVGEYGWPEGDEEW